MPSVMKMRQGNDSTRNTRSTRTSTFSEKVVSSVLAQDVVPVPYRHQTGTAAVCRVLLGRAHILGEFQFARWRLEEK